MPRHAGTGGMEKPLAFIILTIGGFAAAGFLLALLAPSIARTGLAVAADRTSSEVRFAQDASIVNAYSELDRSGVWQDTEPDSLFDVWVWGKTPACGPSKTSTRST